MLRGRGGKQKNLGEKEEGKAAVQVKREKMDAAVQAERGRGNEVAVQADREKGEATMLAAVLAKREKWELIREERPNRAGRMLAREKKQLAKQADEAEEERENSGKPIREDSSSSRCVQVDRWFFS